MVLKHIGKDVEIRYLGTVIRLPLEWFRKVPALADMLDAGYRLGRTDVGTWKLDIPDGPSFFVYDRSLASDLSTIYQRFYQDEYTTLNVEGKVVLDIGANIGDSAIYFAQRGAKKVYAFEPFPETYAQACRNVELNQLAPRVEVFNVGLGGSAEERGVVYDPADSWGLTTERVAPDARSATRTVVVQLVPLAEAIGMCSLDPDDSVICKVDAEGAEYEIFSGSSVTGPGLAAIDEVFMEYHRETAHEIIQTLQVAGFSVVDEGQPYAGAEVGFLRAQRPATLPFDIL